MANKSSNVLVAKPLSTGGCLIGPVGTALPTDEKTALTAPIKAVGYLTDAGVTLKDGKSSTKIKAWGGDTARTVSTDHTVTVEFGFLEFLNGDVLKEVYGADNVTITPASATEGERAAIKITGADLPRRVFVFEVKDGDARVRIVLPNAQITDSSDLKFDDGSAVAPQVTVEAYADASGVKAYLYTNNGLKTA